MADFEKLRQTLIDHGQDHVLQYWDELNGDERAAFAADLETIDFGEMKRQFDAAVARKH